MTIDNTGENAGAGGGANAPAVLMLASVFPLSISGPSVSILRGVDYLCCVWPQLVYARAHGSQTTTLNPRATIDYDAGASRNCYTSASCGFFLSLFPFLFLFRSLSSERNKAPTVPKITYTWKASEAVQEELKIDIEGIARFLGVTVC